MLRFLCGPCRIKGSSRLVLLRSSCCLNKISYSYCGKNGRPSMASYLPFVSTSSLSAFVNHSLYLRDIWFCATPLLSMCVAYCEPFTYGRAIAQPVSHWLPTAAAQVRARVRSCGICRGQSGTGAGFLRVLRFPLPIFIPPVAPQSPSFIIWGWYHRPIVAALPDGLSLTPLRIIIKNVYIQLLIWLYTL
jgi:hypothetical protein